MSKNVNIDLEEIVFRVKFKGQEYELREPDMALIEKYSGLDNGSDAEKAGATKKMLAELGLPLEVSSQMPPRHIKRICEALLGEDKKK